MKRGSVIYCVVVFIGILLATSLVSGAHYITGKVEDALDGTSANGQEVVLWKDGNRGDNLTDIVGPDGNSNQDHTYMVDCELLDNSCQVGDLLKVKVTNGDKYVSGIENVSVSGAGYDIVSNLTLNSPPNVSLIEPRDRENLSTNNVEINCSILDPDADLQEIYLFGNWSGGWHLNETKIVSGSGGYFKFSKNISQGKYKYNCLGKDSFNINNSANNNASFSVDLTDPEVNSIDINVSDVCGTSKTARVNCSARDEEILSIDSVIIEALKPSGKDRYVASKAGNATYSADINLEEIGEWQFKCVANDSSGNNASLFSSPLNVYSSTPDIFINGSTIKFSKLNPIENEEIVINASIENKGCSGTTNFSASFYEGAPLESYLIGSKNISIGGLSSKIVNVSWSARMGPTKIFVWGDSNNSISESDETNNKGNKTINVDGWQNFYGNVSVDKVLADSSFSNMSLWFNESSLSGNVFIADTESNIDWGKLEAIGKTKTGEKSNNDFAEIDNLLDMDEFQDSVSNVFSINKNPKETGNFLVHKRNITGVPIVNSTTNGNFKTGILWDTSDDSNGEFNTNDKEDLVFVNKIRRDTEGKYGVYDYEMRVPARLREYYNTDSEDYYFYYSLK